MNKDSAYPAQIDPLIFFHDVDLEHVTTMTDFQTEMNEGSWDTAQANIESQNVPRYCADLFMLFENRIRATQEHIQGGAQKPDLFRYTASPPTDISVGQSWIDMGYT